MIYFHTREIEREALFLALHGCDAITVTLEITSSLPLVLSKIQLDFQPGSVVQLSLDQAPDATLRKIKHTGREKKKMTNAF